MAMSGDSSGDPMAAISQAQNIQAQTPPWMKNVSPQTMQQGMPGQLQAIAAQLAGGFGGKPADFMKHLDQTYDPVRSMNFNATNAMANKTAPKSAAPKPMDPWTPITMSDGTTKPAWKTSLVQQTGRPKGPPPGR